MTTWLLRDKRVKIGTIITLEKEEGKWEVISYHTEAPMDPRTINRGWNNNI